MPVTTENESSTEARVGFGFTGVLGFDLGDAVASVLLAIPVRRVLVRRGLALAEEGLESPNDALLCLTSLILALISLPCFSIMSSFSGGSVAVRGGLGGAFGGAVFDLRPPSLSSLLLRLVCMSVVSGVNDRRSGVLNAS